MSILRNRRWSFSSCVRLIFISSIITINEAKFSSLNDTLSAVSGFSSSIESHPPI